MTPFSPAAPGANRSPDLLAHGASVPNPGCLPDHPGWDLIYIAGSNVTPEHAQAVGMECSRRRLSCRLIAPQDMSQGIWNTIRSLHQRGELRSHTHVELDIHGEVCNGVHLAHVFPNALPIGTLEIVYALRESGTALGLPYFDGSISLHMCCGGHLREQLSQVSGIHIVCSGKKIVFSRYGLDYIKAVLPLLEAAKRQGCLPDAESFFEQLAAMAPHTVSVVGKELAKNLVRNVRWPGDLAGAGMDRIIDAFRQRISSGKPAHVQAFLQAWPALVSIPLVGFASAFEIAYERNRPEMMGLILSRDDAHWQTDLERLLPVAKAYPQFRERVSVLINRVLDQGLAQACSRPGGLPWQYRQLALESAANHLQRCLKLRNVLDVQPLESTLAQAGMPANLNAALDWHLIDMTGYNAALFLKLPAADVAQFKSDLRLRVLRDRQAAAAMAAMGGN